MLDARSALDRLRDGNGRFVAGFRSPASHATAARRAEVAAEPKPYAVILGCVDARVPPELIFDAGLGDIAVARVAGNIVGPTELDSVEFVARQFGPRLVVVLGHVDCGAVTVAVAEIQAGPTAAPRMATAIVDRIRSAIADEVMAAPGASRADVINRAVHANVRSSVQRLRYGSAGIEALVASQGLQVVGAVYDMASGVVEFFDEQ